MSKTNRPSQERAHYEMGRLIQQEVPPDAELMTTDVVEPRINFHANRMAQRQPAPLTVRRKGRHTTGTGSRARASTPRTGVAGCASSTYVE